MKTPEANEKSERLCPNCKHLAYCENVMYYAYTKKECNEFTPKGEKQ